MKRALKEVAYVLVALCAVLVLIRGVEGMLDLPTDAAQHIVVVALAILLAQLPKVYALRREMLILLDHQKSLDARVRSAVLPFLRPRLQAFLRAVAC